MRSARQTRMAPNAIIPLDRFRTVTIRARQWWLERDIGLRARPLSCYDQSWNNDAV